MKRSSFVCVGAQGGSDSLVYQEIPGRGSGEEFFLFFSAGSPRQEPLFRTLFREAVSASRLGAPLHYFSRLIEQYGVLAAEARRGADPSGPGEEVAGDPLSDAVVLIQIRRGDESHLLCNRDAAVVHWDTDAGAERTLSELPGFAEVPLAPFGEQRDLFERGPADCFALYRFDMGEGGHTLAVLPSRDFEERHREALRDSIFFPSFELPAESQLAVGASRSFPALHWRGAGRPREEARSVSKRVASPRLRVPLWAAGAAAAIAAAVLIAIFAGGRDAPPAAEGPQLAAVDVPDEAPPAKEESDARARTPGEFAEAWRREFRGAVTSSPRCYDGVVYVGCRDGNLYAYGSDGNLVWKHRAADGIGATPLVLEDRVVCADYRGNVFCVERRTGGPAWKRGVGAKIVSSPVSAGDAVYVASTNGKITALRLKDGGRIWERSLGRSIRSTPSAGGDFVVAATTDGVVARLDRRGAVVWRASTGAEIPGSPLVVEERDLVLVGARNGALHAFSLSKGKRVWRYSVGAEVSGSPALAGPVAVVGAKDGALHAITLDGTLAWKSAVGGAVLSKPLVADGIIYATTYGSRLVALDAATGALLGGFKAASPIYSSPDHDGKRIYFGSNGGVLYAVWLSPPA